MVDLEFDTGGEATTFLHFLRANVWSSADNAPALAGAPQAKVLETVEDHQPVGVAERPEG